MKKRESADCVGCLMGGGGEGVWCRYVCVEFWEWEAGVERLMKGSVCDLHEKKEQEGGRSGLKSVGIIVCARCTCGHRVLPSIPLVVLSVLRGGAPSAAAAGGDAVFGR